MLYEALMAAMVRNVKLVVLSPNAHLGQQNATTASFSCPDSASAATKMCRGHLMSPKRLPSTNPGLLHGTSRLFIIYFALLLVVSHLTS